MAKKFKSYEYEFISETDRGFVFKDQDSGNKISLPKKFAEVETDEYDLVGGKIYTVYVQAWLADKNQLDSGGINDIIKKKVTLKMWSASGAAILITTPEGYEFFIPVSWVENPEDIPGEDSEEKKFTLEVSEWKYKKKIEEAVEEENVTGRRMPAGSNKKQTASGDMTDEFIEDDIPF